MKLNHEVYPTPHNYNSRGLNKLEHMSIEFMKALLVDIKLEELSHDEDEYLEQRALFAVKAARILAGVLEAEEGR